MPWTAPPGAGATVHIWNGYSLAERDRRWHAVRSNGAKAGFDCILVPLGNGIDGRYMTQLRCSAMALPTDGRAPIVIADRKSSNQWVAEPWQTGREWAEPMGEALLDLGMSRSHIGVAGLRAGSMTHCSAIDGVVNHTAFEHVKSKVPHASFADATDVIGAVRYVKSAEEIDFVRRSAAVADAGFDELVKRAQPGADAGVIYAGVIARMAELRSEYYPLTLSIDGIGIAKPQRYTNPPIGRGLEADALITSEINAIIGAQLTQICQPISMGKLPDQWKPVVELHRELYKAGLQMIKPGTTFGALNDLVSGFGGRGMNTFFQLHGAGYGDDGPLLPAQATNLGLRELAIEEGNVFIWKPGVASADGKIRFISGGPVLAADSAAEALSRHSSNIVVV